MGHKPFLVLADYLTRKGLAVLRADDRGVGKSTGRYAAATTADFATDAEAGLKYLKTRREVDPHKIGMIGHSEGGIVAPIVAVRDPEDVAFIVMMASPGLRGDDILCEILSTRFPVPTVSHRADQHTGLRTKLYSDVRSRLL